MKRNRRRKRKLLTAMEPPPPPLGTGARVGLWSLWFGLSGLLLALLLILSLYLRTTLPDWLWQILWPPSIGLVNAAGLSARQEAVLAYLLAAENGLLYAITGALLGLGQAGYLRLREWPARR